MEDELDFDVDLDGAGVGDDELGGDDDYEDLYDDVNVGFLQEQQSQVQAQAGTSSHQGQESGAWREEEAEAKPNEAAGKQATPAVAQEASQGLARRDRDPDPGYGESGRISDSTPPQQQVTQAPVRLSADAIPSVVISDLQWWTTDAELEFALAECGKVKGLKFIEERASGKSKGVCQVDFEDAYAAQACREKMNGRVFNGRPCVVQFASSQALKQANMKAQGPPPANQGGGQTQQGVAQGKKSTVVGRGSGSEGGGRGGYSGKPVPGGRGGGRGRGRGEFGQMPSLGGMGMYDPSFGAGIRPGMYGMGFMARGPYPMPFPPGVAPHVNPAFFGRGGAANGHMMGSWGNGGSGAAAAGWGGDESSGAGGGGGGYEEENADYEEGGKGTSSRKEDKDYKERGDGWDNKDRGGGYSKRDKGSSRYDDNHDEDYGKRRRHG